MEQQMHVGSFSRLDEALVDLIVAQVCNSRITVEHVAPDTINVIYKYRVSHMWDETPLARKMCYEVFPAMITGWNAAKAIWKDQVENAQRAEKQKRAIALAKRRANAGYYQVVSFPWNEFRVYARHLLPPAVRSLAHCWAPDEIPETLAFLSTHVTRDFAEEECVCLNRLVCEYLQDPVENADALSYHGVL